MDDDGLRRRTQADHKSSLCHYGTGELINEIKLAKWTPSLCTYEPLDLPLNSYMYSKRVISNCYCKRVISNICHAASPQFYNALILVHDKLWKYVLLCVPWYKTLSSTLLSAARNTHQSQHSKMTMKGDVWLAVSAKFCQSLLLFQTTRKLLSSLHLGGKITK